MVFDGFIEFFRIFGVVWDCCGIAHTGAAYYLWVKYRWRLQPVTISPLRNPAKLHFLHCVTDASPLGVTPVLDGEVVGRYRLHYTDGQTREIRLVLGRDVADWLDVPSEAQLAGHVPGKPRVAWSNTGPNGEFATIYHTVRDNPRPDVPLQSIEISTGSFSTLHVLAITLE